MKAPFKFDFIKNTKKYFIGSSVIILAGILFSFIFGVRMDIEFSGGTIFSYIYDGSIDINEFKNTVQEGLGGMDVSVTSGTDFMTGKNTFRVELVSRSGINSDIQFELSQKLDEVYGENNLKLTESSDVSPTSGREFFLKCLVAVIFSSIVLIIYVAIRFRNIGGWLAGVSAVAALFHDLLIVYATFVFCRMEIDANFMAVLLTILGYSVNDTIVIYDRIRENERLYKKDKMTRAELTNLSVNQSLTRSLNTSITTIMAMLTVTIVCVIFGVDSIVSFSFPVMIGMISGTYSSICIAGPLWVLLEGKRKSKKEAKPKTA